MKQSIALLATLACAQATKLSSRVKFISIPSFDDITDVFDDGIDIIGDGLTDFGDIIVDGYDITVGGLEDLGEMTIDGFNAGVDFVVEDVGDFIVEDIGDFVVEDIGDFVVEDIGDFVVDDVGSFVVDDVGGFVVDDIGGGFTDAWDWASNDGNWAAFGKTMLAGGKLFFEGDFDGAGDVWGNDELYTEKFWNDLED